MKQLVGEYTLSTHNQCALLCVACQIRHSAGALSRHTHGSHVLFADGTRQQHSQTIFAVPTLSWIRQVAFSKSLNHCWLCGLHWQVTVAGLQVPAFCWSA